VDKALDQQGEGGLSAEISPVKRALGDWINPPPSGPLAPPAR